MLNTSSTQDPTKQDLNDSKAVVAFKRTFTDSGAYSRYLATLPVRKPQSDPIEQPPQQAPQPDFVFTLLSDESNWTEDILTGLMEQAIVAGRKDPATCRKMAIKFRWILYNSKRIRAKRGERPWIPTQSCVDLTTTGAALTVDEALMTVDEVRQLWVPPASGKVRKKRQVVRHFVNCLGCGRRFKQKRSDNTTCSPKCRARAMRRAKADGLSQISAQTPLQPA